MILPTFNLIYFSYKIKTIKKQFKLKQKCSDLTCYKAVLYLLEREITNLKQAKFIRFIAELLW